MDFASIVKWLRDEWAEVRKAKAAVAVMVVLAAGATWWAAGVFYGERLAILKEARESADRKVKDLQAQLNAHAHEPSQPSPTMRTSPTSPPKPSTTTEPENPAPPKAAGCQEFATVTPGGILSEINRATPYEQTRIRGKYSGFCVRWTLKYMSLATDRWLGTTAYFAEAPATVPWVHGDVSLDRYPELKIANEGDWFQVEGRIKEVGDLMINVDLTDLRRAQAPATSSAKAKRKK